MAETAGWHTAAALSEVKEGEPLGVEIAGRSVALYRVADEYYATGNICTHAEALLSDGMLDGCEIECPLHMGRFDIRTGEALTSPVEIDIPVYPVRVAGERLEVCLPQ
ncbi:MAG: non-heme iron oxygenase ferredoxin subunit [Bradyrhizobium sp.]|nr:non-heme iron oxygenase ferredoxin subunit [Bradyrhizobium sp.]